MTKSVNLNEPSAHHAQVWSAAVRNVELDLGSSAPRGVEKYGAEAVPLELKTGKWYEIFQIQFSMALNNPANLITPGMAIVFSGLSFWEALIAASLGTAISIAIGSLGTLFGVKYGLPGTIGMRSAFGTLGARTFVSGVRGLTGIYWFGFQALGAALGIQAILNTWIGWEIDVRVVAVSMAVTQVACGVVGYDALKQIGRFLWILGLFLCGLLMFLFASSLPTRGDILLMVQSPGHSNGWQSIALWAGVISSMWIAAAISAMDISRYTRSRPVGYVSYFAGIVFGTVLSAAAGAFVAVVSGNWNPFAAAGQLQVSSLAFAVLAVSFFVSLLMINAFNVYVSGMALVNVVPRLGRFKSSITTGVMAIGVCTMPTVIYNAQAWISEIGSVFGPLVGVFLADYFVIRGEFIDVEALFDDRGIYRYFGGINPVAIVVTAAGYAFSRALPEWAMPQISALAASAVFYVLLLHLGARFSGRLRATMPARDR